MVMHILFKTFWRTQNIMTTMHSKYLFLLQKGGKMCKIYSFVISRISSCSLLWLSVCNEIIIKYIIKTCFKRQVGIRPCLLRRRILLTFLSFLFSISSVLNAVTCFYINTRAVCTTTLYFLLFNSQYEVHNSCYRTRHIVS